MATILPVMLMSGVIWPVEAIPFPLHYLSYVIPTMWAANAMRSLCLRKWGFLEYDVWMGYAVTAAWCLGLLVLASRLLRNRN
jgi:ABC-type multidrug transport system permease subunit